MNRTIENPRILLSEGSSNSARQTLYGLARGSRVDILDPSPWCQCRFSTRVSRRIRCPQIAKDPVGYVRCVAELVRRERYDVLFPTHEQVYAFSRFRSQFLKQVGLAVPEFDAIQRVQSKAEFALLMEEIGLPTPVSRIVHSKSELFAHTDFPCFLKVAHSTASLGVERVSDPVALEETVKRFEAAAVWREGLPIVLQQPAPGTQAEVGAVFQDGRMVAVACADVLATGIGGGPALRITANHSPVIEHVERFGNALKWHGPLSLEYFYDAHAERPYYIECNPRIGESYNSLAGGVNLCDATVRISMGEQVNRVPDVRPGVLTHNGFIVTIADAYNGASRIELLRKIWAHWTRGDGGQSEMTRMKDDWLSAVPATAVIMMLLVNPKAAKGLAKGTVDNYSLPHHAARIIEELPSETIEEIEKILS